MSKLPHPHQMTIAVIRIAEILIDGVTQIQPEDDSWYKQDNRMSEQNEDDDHDQPPS